MTSEPVVAWRAPRTAVVGPVAVAALIDSVVLGGRAGTTGWLLAVAATAAGLAAAYLFSRTSLLLTPSDVVVRNGVATTRIARHAIKAVEAVRDGVDIYFRDGDTVRVVTTHAAGVLAGYFGRSRSAGIATSLAAQLGVHAASPWLRRNARRY